MMEANGIERSLFEAAQSGHVTFLVDRFDRRFPQGTLVIFECIPMPGQRPVQLFMEVDDAARLAPTERERGFIALRVPGADGECGLAVHPDNPRLKRIVGIRAR